MNQEKYKAVMNILSDKDQNSIDEIRGNILDIMKSLIGETNSKDKNILWFERDNIKCDKDYCQIISSYFDIIILYFDKNKSFDFKKFSKEILYIAENNKYSTIFKLTRELFRKLDSSEEIFYDLYWSVFFLGFKKDSPLNSIFVENLKEISQYEKVINTNYSKYISEFNFNNINESFLIDLNNFIDLILIPNSKDLIILGIIEKLKQKRDVAFNICEKGQFEKLKKEEQKKNVLISSEPDINKIKDEKEDIFIKESEKTEPQNNILNQNSEKKEENKKELQCTSESNLNKSNGGKENIVKNNNTETEDKNKNFNSPIEKEFLNKEEQEQEPTTDETVERDIIDDLNNSFEKAKEEFQGQNINNDFAKLLLFQFQKHDRYNGIINLISSIRKELNEYKVIVQNQNELFSQDCIIHENLIQINRLNMAISQLKPPTIINIKRKFIDILIYLILKNNSKLFDLQKEYSPNSDFLQKVLNKLERFKKIETVKKKIKFVKDLKNKNLSTTEFPFIEKDSSNIISLIVRFLSFYKKKCSNIIHLEKKTTKYYYLPGKEKKKDDYYMINIFNIYRNNNISDSLDIKTESYEKNLKNKNKLSDDDEELIEIDFDIFYKFLFSSNLQSSTEDDLDDLEFKKEMDMIKMKKSTPVNSTCNLIVNSINTIVSSVKNDLFNFPLSDDIFNENEKNWINGNLKEFRNKIKSLENMLLILKNGKNNPLKINEEISKFFNNFYSLLKREINFDCKYFYNLNETILERYLLVYFQYKVIKLETLYDMVRGISQALPEIIKQEKKSALDDYNKIIKKTKYLNDKIVQSSKLKTPNEIFIEWKHKQNHYNIDYEIFINNIEASIKETAKIKIDDEIIEDKITTLWLIINGLDELVLN